MERTGARSHGGRRPAVVLTAVVAVAAAACGNAPPRADEAALQERLDAIIAEQDALAAPDGTGAAPSTAAGDLTAGATGTAGMAGTSDGGGAADTAASAGATAGTPAGSAQSSPGRAGARQPTGRPDPAAPAQDHAGPEAAPDAGSAVEATGPGVTEEGVLIGVQYVEDTQAAFAAVGASGAPSERQLAQTMIDWVNANGGVQGRPLVPVWHATESTAGTWSSQAQAACATFTEDHQVMLVVDSATGGSDALWACLSKQGVPLVERNLWLFDDPYFEEAPGMLFQPGKMSPDRWGRHWIDGLAELGFFDGARLGLLRFDADVFDRIANEVVSPTLATHGVELVDEIEVRTPQSVSDFGSMNAEISNAIIRLRQNGVTHVVFLENAGILPYFFMPQAESQSYRPRYGLSSADIPMTLNAFAPQEQLRNAVGVSWTPPNDVHHTISSYERHASYTNFERCREIYDGAVGFHATSMCDAFLFTKAAVDRASSLTRRGVAEAGLGLGDAYQSPMAVTTSMGPGSFGDGAAATRNFAWRESCGEVNGEDLGCYEYVTGPAPVPRR